MTLDEYQGHLRQQGHPAETIAERLAIVQCFARYLAAARPDQTPAAGKQAAEAFARRLVDEGRNTLGNLRALCDYADWLGRRELHVGLIEVMDCHNALQVLADQVEARHGRQTRDRVFAEELPPLGASENERCAYTQALAARLRQHLTPSESGAAWFQVQHGIAAEAWRDSDAADREKYRRCGAIDAFLDLKRQERDALLTRLRDEGRLWYTVEIDDEVLEFVRRDPEMEVGHREGDTIYISKIPYNAVRYLRESDPRMKRYCACHCPLVRQAILQDQPIAADVCHCSLGHASHYLSGLDVEVEGEVLESVLKGDIRCRFAFHLPGRH